MALFDTLRDERDVEQADRSGSASLRTLATAVLGGLALAGWVAVWYVSKHSPAGFETWSRREETVAPSSLVFSWRRPHLEDISPPF